MKHRMAAVISSVFVLGAVSVSTALPAGAAAPIVERLDPSTIGTLPAGVACPFAVSIDLIRGGGGTQFTFLDHGGDFLRLMIVVPRTSTWLITNLETDATTTVTIPGGLTRISPAADGTTLVTFSGGVIGFNAPTDRPPGPFASTNVGRFVVVVATDGTITLEKSRGRTTDLCAAVSE